MSWIDERIQMRKENDQIMFENSFNDLAGIKNIVAGEEKDLRGNFICHQLINYFKLSNAEIPYHIDGMSGKMDYLFRLYGVIGRKITLGRGWNVEHRDPILVFSKRTNTPILLIPEGSRRYYYISYSTGKKKKMTPGMIQYFQSEAYAFYKQLPKNKLTVKEYFRYFRDSIRFADLLWVTVFSVAATAIGMLMPYIMKMLTGEVIDNNDLNLFYIATAYIIGAGLAYILVKATQGFMNARVGIKLEKLMAETTMKKLLSLPPSFFKKYTTGELTARFNSVQSLASMFFGGIFLTTLSSIMSLAYMTQIVQFAPSLILPVAAIILLTSSSSVIVALVSAKVSKKQLYLASKESSVTYSIISGIQKIRLAGAEKRAFANWAQAYARSSEYLYHPPLIIRLSTFVSLLISLLGNIAIYYIAARNSISVSSFVAFTTSFGSLSSMAASLSYITSMLAQIKPVLDMARPIIEEEQEDNGKEIVENLDGRIRFEDVSFRYDDQSGLVLKNFSLDIHSGEYLGIVGKTGCGKSTIVRLLLGFEKPVSGNIYFGDKNINEINLQSLRGKIGSVLQNGGIFHADIMSNILITAPNLGEKEAWEAAEIAGIAEDIRNMPMGMRTVISEGQGGISGGQKQRIMIARAIINKPKILVFDEATSALDNKTQKNISEAISSLNCTRIVIAHRLSTIKNCDRILYLEQGEIVEEGTYDELVEKKGKFFELIERQRVEE